MKISQIVESATTAGSIATVESPLGTTQSRTQKPPKSPKVVKGRKFANTISEGKMKEIAYDLQHMDAGNFKKKYGKTKEEVQASLKEEKIAEADLIVVPGMRKSKDKSFIPHKEDRRDHEVEMARSDLYAAAKDAMRIFKLLKDRSEDDGIMGWQQSYITLASDYLNSVADSLEYQMNMYEMTGGVLAGGMSNFEEGVMEGHADQQRKIFKKNGKPVGEVGIDRESSPGLGQWYMKCYAYDIDNSGYDSYEEAVAELKYCLKQGVAEGSVVSIKDNPATLKRLAKQWWNGNEQQHVHAQQMLEKMGWDIYEDDDNIILSKDDQEHILPMDDLQGLAEGRYYDPMGDERREQQAMDDERREFKRREMEYELRNEPKNNYAVHINGRSWKVFGDKAHAEAVARKLRMKGKKAEVFATGAPVSEAKAHKCPECGGELVSEEMINEKKDACYYKVKSRYKVWPSAYASGALVKCRKKGASNWGNKSK